MANADQLSKQLLESMEIIGKSITDGLEFDKTIKAVVQSSDGTNYSCKCNDIIFTAVGPEGEYIVGDNVWVNIPQNDWKNQKTIISRSESDVNINRVILPFSNLISVDNDRAFYESSSEYTILANGATQEVLIDTISSLYTNYKEPYDLLGIKASFNTGKLTPFNVTDGNYGIRLKLKNKDDELIATYEFDCSTMLGNLYAFNDWIEQQYVFDISELGNGTIQPTDKLEIYLIQKADFFGYHTSATQKEYLAYQTGDDTSDNIAARGIKLFLGYNRNNITVDEGDLVLVDGDYLYYEGWQENGRNIKKFVSSIWKLDEGGTLYRESNIESLVWSFGNDKNWEVIPTTSKSFVNGVAIVTLPQDRLKEDNIYFRCGKSVVTLSRFKAPMYSIEYDMEHAIRLSYSYDKMEEQDGVHYWGPESKLAKLDEAFAPHFIDLNWEPLSAEIANDPNFLAGATITWTAPGYNYYHVGDIVPDVGTNRATIIMPPVDGREYCSDYDKYHVETAFSSFAYTFGDNFVYKQDYSSYREIARNKGAFNSMEDLALKVRDVNHCMFKFRVKHQYISTMTNNTITCTIKKGVYTFKGSFDIPVIVEKKPHAQVVIYRDDLEPLYITNKDGVNALNLMAGIDDYGGNFNSIALNLTGNDKNFFIMREANWGYIGENTQIIPNSESSHRNSPFSHGGHFSISSFNGAPFRYKSYPNTTSYLWNEEHSKYYRYVMGVSGYDTNIYKIFYFDFATRVQDSSAISITVGGVNFKYYCETIDSEGVFDLGGGNYGFVVYASSNAGQSDATYFSEVMTVLENPTTDFYPSGFQIVFNQYTPITLSNVNSYTVSLSLPFTGIFGDPNALQDDNIKFLAVKVITDTDSRQGIQYIPIVYRTKYDGTVFTSGARVADTSYISFFDGPNRFYTNSEGEVISTGQMDENGYIRTGIYHRTFPFGKTTFNKSNWSIGGYGADYSGYVQVIVADNSTYFTETTVQNHFIYGELTSSWYYYLNAGAAKEYSEFVIPTKDTDQKYACWISKDAYVSIEHRLAWEEMESGDSYYPLCGFRLSAGFAPWYDWRYNSNNNQNYSSFYNVAIVQYINNWSDDFNQWDGNSVKIGDTSIFARSIAAGTKNRGQFTGVVLGDIANIDGNTRAYGLFGYQRDEQSFGLMSTGKAFFGKKGNGRIEIDGSGGTITSGRFVNDGIGMKLDLDAPYLTMANVQSLEGTPTNFFLKIDASNTNLNLNDKPLKIGYGNSPKFTVNWKGELTCSDAIINGARITDIIQAEIASNGSLTNNGTINNAGTISGGTVENVTITGDNTDLNLANLRIRRTGVEFSSGFMDINSGCSFRFHSENMDKYLINFVSAIHSDGTYTVGTMYVIGTEPAYNTYTIPFSYLESISQTTTTGSPLATITDNNGNSTTIYRGNIPTNNNT